MRRPGCVIALLVLLLSPALADPALPGLVRQDRMVPIALADGSQVKLETMILRPSRLLNVVTPSHRSCGGALVIQRDDLPRRCPDLATIATIWQLRGSQLRM